MPRRRDPAHRHGRVLCVRRAARRPVAAGKPVAVGGSPAGRGVVAAASYEARAFGVRSAMPMARAVRLCPHLSIVRPDFQKYRAASQAVFEIFRSVTPRVEPLSLDEAYLDVTENAWGLALGREVALRIKAAIRERTALTASAGVAPNKFLAKIASAWKKPDGLTVIAPERVERFLQKLPVDALWGVGPVTAQRLRERGIERLIDVRIGRDVGAPARGRRQPRRLAAPAGRRHRRSAGRRESRGEVVRDREHLLAGPDRASTRSAARSTRWRAMTPDGWSGRACSAGRSRSRCATTTSRPSRAATRSLPGTRDAGRPRRHAPSRCSTGPRPASARCGCSASACTTSIDPDETLHDPPLPLFDELGQLTAGSHFDSRCN